MSLPSLALDSAVGSEVNAILKQQGNVTTFCTLYTYKTSTTRERPGWHVNIQQAGLVVGSPRRCTTDI